MFCAGMISRAQAQSLNIIERFVPPGLAPLISISDLIEISKLIYGPQFRVRKVELYWNEKGRDHPGLSITVSRLFGIPVRC